MIKLIFLTIITTSVFISSLAFAQVGFRCENCTDIQQQDCAKAYGDTLPLNSPRIIWVADFPNTTIRRFEVWKKDISLSPESESKDDDTRVSTIVTVSEQTLTLAEATESHQAALYINRFLRPAGVDISMPGCLNTRSADEPEQYVSNRTDQPIAVEQYNAPVDVAASGFDVVGDSVLGNRIGQFIQANDPITLFIGSVLDVADRFFNSSLNFSVAYLATFEDGSSGLWGYDALRERLSADFSSFEDSEGNPIPFRLDDINGRTFMFSNPGNGGGSSGRGSSNMSNMTSRITLIGGSITGGAGSGCSEVIFQCNSQGCTVTCRVK